MNETRLARVIKTSPDVRLCEEEGLREDLHTVKVLEAFMKVGHGGN